MADVQLLSGLPPVRNPVACGQVAGDLLKAPAGLFESIVVSELPRRFFGRPRGGQAVQPEDSPRVRGVLLVLA